MPGVNNQAGRETSSESDTTPRLSPNRAGASVRGRYFHDGRSHLRTKDSNLPKPKLHGQENGPNSGLTIRRSPSNKASHTSPPPGTPNHTDDTSDSKGSPTSSAFDARGSTSASSPSLASLAGRTLNHKTSHVSPEDFDLAAPIEDRNDPDSVEKLSDLMFSSLHLQTILDNPASLLKFTSFLNTHRPQSLPTLIYYLDATKALKAIKYADAVASSLEQVSQHNLGPISTQTSNEDLEDKAQRAFDVMAENDLPPYVAFLFTLVVKSKMMVSAQESESSIPDDTVEGLNEIFCLTDPRREDNPIVFASPAFHQLTEYSMSYIIGRNCRFLQGPRTHPSSPKRIARAIAASETNWEVFVNYRRDGSPFLNLLMCAPLRDQWGVVRYFLGAQIDVSRLVYDRTSHDLGTLHQTIARAEGKIKPSEKAAFQGFIEMLDLPELKAIRALEDRLLHEKPRDGGKPAPAKPSRLGISLRARTLELSNAVMSKRGKGMQLGLYNKFLLVRPYPSLQILFASPAMSVPGLIQTPILDKINSSGSVRHELAQALEEGREVTAKVIWKAKASDEGYPRWIVCTPLVGRKGQIGVWMVVLDDQIPATAERRRPRNPARVNPKTAGPIMEVFDEQIDEVGLAAPQRPEARNAGHRLKISWSGPEVPQELRSPKLQWGGGSAGSSVDGTLSDGAYVDSDEYVSLEERLRRKRERDRAMMLGGEAPTQQTYKSLSPETLIKET